MNWKKLKDYMIAMVLVYTMQYLGGFEYTMLTSLALIMGEQIHNNVTSKKP